MFSKNWRQHWGLTEDPFACEDADKDLILGSIDPAAVHSGFDRIFGNPKAPAPGIVFGEKGSGKSGLRRMTRRWLDKHNEDNPGERTFLVDYIDFDAAMENFQRSLGITGADAAAAKQVLEKWEISDHLDSILSLGVTRLTDELLDGEARPVGMTPKQRSEFLILNALYYDSPRRGIGEVLKGVRKAVGARNLRPGSLKTARFAASAAAVGLALVPHLWDEAPGEANWWYVAGAVVLALTWGAMLLGWISLTSRAGSATRSVRVKHRDPAVLRDVLASFKPKDRPEFVLPKGSDAATRYELLDQFLRILGTCGYTGCYVLVDRIDEPSLLSGSDDRMQRFVEKLLDIKLLQFPGLALKLFLPIEMEPIYRSAGSESLKRMRLDKSNLIPELKWTGQELFEIANQRFKACTGPDARAKDMTDLFADDLDFNHLRETLGTLGTPRYAFGFLSALLTEHVRELPNDMDPDDERWRCPRAQFDVVRAAWVDRTGILRRSLN